MEVKAAEGTRVPKEGKPKDYINDKSFVTVPDTTYYRRLVRDTSLVTPESESLPTASAGAETKTKARKTAGEEA